MMTGMMRLALTGLMALTTVFAGRLEAEVTITGTRVIYPAASKEVTVQLTNHANVSALVQVWLDDGDMDASPDQIKVPFNVSPPIVRMEPHRGQAVRVAYTNAPLPADRESLFWFNLLEIPPKAGPEAGENLLQFAVRTRIKLVFRPDNLSAEQALEAPRQLQWTMHTGENGKSFVLRVTNPTPYYVNFASVGAKTTDKEITGSGGYVAPNGTAEFPLSEFAGHSGADVQVVFKTISDLGVVTPYTKALPL
jgi:chaperone protein EcpD